MESEFDNDKIIKRFNKPYYLTTHFNTSVYYYMRVSENNARHNDALIYGQTSETKYIETRIDYNVIQDLPSNEGNHNSFVAVYIQMDDTSTNVQRNVYTLM